MTKEHEQYQVEQIVRAVTELWYSPPTHTSEQDLYDLVKKVTREWLKMPADDLETVRLEINVTSDMWYGYEYERRTRDA